MRDRGLYAATGKRDVADPTTTSGKRSIANDPRLLLRTNDICAQLGTMFGVEYEVAGPAPFQIEVDIDHPEMRNHAGAMQSRDVVWPAVQAGMPHWSGWVFADPEKLIPGDWTYTVRVDGRVGLVETFHVSFNCSQPIAWIILPPPA